MNDLQTIIVIAAALSVPVSIWGIVYFAGRIITQYRVNRDLGNMPSQEELRAWYEQNNLMITYGKHSPIRKDPSQKKKITLQR